MAEPVEKKDGLWWHNLDSDFSGEGRITKDQLGKITIAKGEFVKGKLVKGIIYSKNLISVSRILDDGTFNVTEHEKENNSLVFEGICHISITGTTISFTYLSGKLKRFSGWRWGKFEKGQLCGPGKVTEDEEGKILDGEGIFDRGSLISGKQKYKGKWYWGNFVNGYLTGLGKVTKDEEGTEILSEGVYRKDVLDHTATVILNELKGIRAEIKNLARNK